MANRYTFTESSTKSNPWTGAFRQSDGANLTLFCFPYAGGTSLAFKNWAALMPNSVDVCPVHLPGRSARIGEPPFRTISPLVEVLGDALLPYNNRPFVFFGHSMGSLISFELARYYRRHGVAQPVHIYASGHRAPHVLDPDPPTYDVPDNEFIAELRRLNGTPQEVLDNAELLELMMPLLRADFELCQTYSCEDEPPLSCPITAFGGIDDVDVPRSLCKGSMAFTRPTDVGFITRILRRRSFSSCMLRQPDLS